MPDVLNDILARRSAADDQRLAQADHAANWTQTFNAPNSTENLRAQANVTDLVNSALQRKMELAATTDKNAQEIYQNGEKFKEWQADAPLRDAHLRAQIDATGASERYRQQRDAATLGQVASFYKGMVGIEAPLGTPEHASAVQQLAAQHPLALSTAAVREDLKGHAKIHDTAAALNQPASEYASIDALRKDYPNADARQNDKTGGFSVAYDRAPDAGGGAGGKGGATDPGKELLRIHKITPTELLNPVAVQYGEWKGEGKNAKFLPDADGRTGGKVAQIDVGRDAMVHMSAGEYARYKTALGGAPAPAAAPAVVDRKALAQQALDDPNASEAHKAAARKILGQ